jgi:hypothetical protein
MTHKLPNLIEDLLYSEEYHLLDNSVGFALKRAAMLGVADKFVRDTIHQRVERDRIQQATAGPFPVGKMTHGDLVLGLDIYGRPIRCPVQYFNEPSLTVGSTGCGKTTKSRFWMLQLANKVRGLWLFDFRKREMGILRPYLWRLGVDLRVARARDMRVNPLEVPYGTDPRDYAPQATDMLVRVLKSPQRATKLLYAKILQVYAEFGVLEGSCNYPTLFDLRESVAADREANPQARQAIVDSLDPLLVSLGKVLCVRRGWTTNDLARRHIVFELGGIPDTEKDLLLNTLVLGVFASHISRGISNPNMKLLICCDEAARLVGSSDNSVSDLIGVVRGTGIGLDLSVQSSEVSKAILSNTPNKFVGRITSYTDPEAVGSSMGLNQDQRRWLSRNLVPGMFVGQLGQGNWRNPFVF